LTLAVQALSIGTTYMLLECI